MNTRTRVPRRSRLAMAPGIDRLESRQLLSMILKPVHGPALAHHHELLRLHQVAEVGRAHTTHHGKAVPVATPATSSGLSVVAQFNNDDFEATTAIADNDIWAVGSTSSGTEQPVAVHFNGTSWSAVATPTLPNGGYFGGVAAAASNDVWAVGSKNVGSSSNTLIEHWNGTSWSIVSSPTLPNGAFLSSVTAVSSTNVWAVGANNNFTGDLVEHWNGTSWSIVTSSAFNGATDILYSISADSSNDVWAVGNDFGVGTSILHFNGTSWSRTATPASAGLFGVTALSPTDVWAVGIRTGGKCCPSALIERFNGTSWSSVSSPDPNPHTTVSLSGIAAISANDIWAGGYAAEQWNGTSWSIIATPSGLGQLEGVTALSDGTVVMVSNEGYILEN